MPMLTTKLDLPFTAISPSVPGTFGTSALPITLAGTGVNGIPVAYPSYAGGLDEFGSALIDCIVQGAVGGSLTIYFQSSVTKGKRWYDVAALPVLAAGAPTIRYEIALSRARGGGTSAAVVVNTLDDTPSLVNSVLQFNFGDSLRMLFVAGAGTSAGALQTINATAMQI
jgi:hypothetical protein